MPKIYRAMAKDGDGLRVADEDVHGLGLRLQGKQSDISVNQDGTVSPQTGGLSVNPSLEAMAKHPFLVSVRLRARGGIFRRARAPDYVHAWRMGQGAFQAGAVAPGLVLRPDEGNSPQHGQIEPDSTMQLDAYRQAITATKDQWEIGED